PLLERGLQWRRFPRRSWESGRARWLRFDHLDRFAHSSLPYRLRPSCGRRRLGIRGRLRLLVQVSGNALQIAELFGPPPQRHLDVVALVHETHDLGQRERVGTGFEQRLGWLERL